jgi:hypothetical protein
MKTLEKIGFALIIIGFTFFLLARFVEHPVVLKMEEHYKLFFWVGMLIWALGHQGRISQEKKAKSTSAHEK